MPSPLKVATPSTALTVVVPDRIAPLVPVPGVMATVTAAEGGHRVAAGILHRHHRLGGEG